MKNIILYFFKVFGKIFYLLYPYSFSTMLLRMRVLLYTYWIAPNLKSLGKNSKIGLGLYLVNGKDIVIGSDTIIGRGSFLTAIASSQYTNTPKIIIGDGCIFGPDSHITAVNLVKIGNGVRTGKSILITDNSHGGPVINFNIPPDNREIFSKGSVIIEDNVWIGEKVAIIPNVKVGYGAIIGANSVVTKDVPPYCVVGGVPAKIIRRVVNNKTANRIKNDK